MIGFVPVSYFLSMYAHISLGMDATEATHLLLFFFVGYFVAAQLGGRIFDARGAKPTILLGCAIAAAGFVWWATQVTHLDASAQHLPLLVAGAGVGLLLGPSSADAVSRAHDASYGEVTGVNQTVRNYGSALGFAVLGTVLAQRLHQPVHPVAGRPRHPAGHRRAGRLARLQRCRRHVRVAVRAAARACRRPWSTPPRTTSPSACRPCSSAWPPPWPWPSWSRCCTPVTAPPRTHHLDDLDHSVAA